MSDPILDLDQRLRAPLLGFHGAPPPAPPWFRDAIARKPERSVTEVEGAGIEALAWGERGRPGLLLVHGGMANADWFAHIAPAFADDWRVAAPSLSGMGRSDWRAHYSVAQFAREMVAVARATGLYEAGPPVFVAHSFGSRPLMNAMADPAMAPRAGVILDSAVSPPDAPDIAMTPRPPHRIYPSLEAAVERFRLAPYQVCDNLFILDYIARQSVREVRAEDGTRGWSWRFDPDLFVRVAGVERADSDAALRGALCPMALIYADRSAIMGETNLAYTRSAAPPGLRLERVEGAGHHLFLDQPLATIEVLKRVLADFGAGAHGVGAHGAGAHDAGAHGAGA